MDMDMDRDENEDLWSFVNNNSPDDLTTLSYQNLTVEDLVQMMPCDQTYSHTLCQIPALLGNLFFLNCKFLVLDHSYLKFD